LTEHGTAQATRVTLSLVIPVFNEEDSLDAFILRIDEVFRQQTSIALELVFVNDGSTDATLEGLLERQRHDSRLRIVDLSRNFGKEAALSAGLQIATGQIVVPIDADLQDPPEVILQMIERWREGYEVVLGHRISRRSDTWAKQTSATGSIACTTRSPSNRCRKTSVISA
jgi:glycosyltransferase involved in cell wall biosynthesis